MAEEKKLPEEEKPEEEKPEEEKKSGGVSRREFLKDAGFVVGGAAVAAGATRWLAPEKEVVTEVPVEVEVVKEVIVPGPPETIKLTVNGHLHELVLGVDVNEWDTLVLTLRDVLKLTGTKIWCDSTDCGACAVLINGESALSCSTLTVECDGKEITTIEGLANPETGELHPVQQAFIEEYGFQCGFCTPGFIIATKAFLDENPNPTDQEARDALAGNMCRCTGYVKIIDSVLAAAAMLRKTGSKG